MQKQVLQLIIQHKSPVVAIIGIRVGKSILFILLVLVSSGVMVVIVPLVSLQKDIKARYRKLGIIYVE